MPGESSICPDSAQLQDFHAGRLKGETARRVAEHTQGCTTCRTELAELSLDDRFADDLCKILPEGPGNSSRSLRGESSGGGEPDPEHEALLALLRESAEGERYEILRELGHGGMGVVYEVRDRVLHRDLAMKVTGARGPSSSTPASSTGRRLARFLEEARITGQLDHPSIIPVHELGVDAEGRAFFTMSRVQGKSLREVFKEFERGEGDWTLPGMVALILRACDAIAYAHSKRVVHRDLKPANIMVGLFGVVYVMDWGVAKVMVEDGQSARAAASGLSSPASLRSRRGAPGREDESASPLFTLDGEVLGTPAYMAPEQALGRADQVDPRTDVYSMGAIFYRLLSGRRQYDEEVEPGSPRTTWSRLLDGPPAPLTEIAPQAPPELVAISERAMARDPAARYADMAGLAADLRAWLEGRVVSAHETGTWAETKKWVQRNKPLATAIAAGVLAMAAGLATSLVFKSQSDENAAHATRERDNVLRLSAFQKLAELRGEADELWPAASDRIDDFRGWLDRARELIAGLERDSTGNDPGHRAQLASLRSRALPQTPEERERDRLSHPRLGDLLELEGKLAATRAAREVREGTREPGEFELDPLRQAVPSFQPVLGEGRTEAMDLNNEASLLTDLERKVFGREAEGLALARAALQRATTDDHRAMVGDTLAWALFSVGLDDEALAASREALAAAARSREPEVIEGLRVRWFEETLERLEEEVRSARGDAGAQAIADMETEVEALRVEAGERLTFAFADERDRWWHAQLEKLVAEIETFADEEEGLVSGRSPLASWSVARRREFAEELRDGFAPGGEFSARWERDLPAIREAYPGLVLPAQVGLVPIGADPDSGLWEFWHQASGDEPRRGADGKLEMTEQSGLVLVLLAGGRVWMGAQSSDPQGRHFDPDAPNSSKYLTGDIRSPVHEVVLSPFFLSKFELTQGQWKRMTGENPSIPGAPTALYPVEQVSWPEYHLWLPRMGLTLPSEAQWEYGARGGTDTPWWTGVDKLSLYEQHAANLADQAAARWGVKWQAIEDFPELDDGAAMCAEVGTYAANAFGLHDVCGNLSEWCLDGATLIKLDEEHAEPGPVETDPVSPWEGASWRWMRGGSYSGTASGARSAHRHFAPPSRRYENVGARPAWVIQT